jgi:hypothetical protein
MGGPCYDPSKITVAYRNTEPTHHTGVDFICITDINGTYRRVDLDDIRKAFSAPKTAVSCTPDPWKHRSAGMRCQSCMWSVMKDVPEGCKIVGRCRRHAPTMNGYPIIFADDWCGDHKLDENKA